MADVIEGTSEHTHYAPLSQSSVQQIARYLQDQIRALDAKLHEVVRNLGNTDQAVAALQAGNGGAHSAIHQLQEALKSTSNNLDGTKRELARTNVNVAKCQQGLLDANDSIGGLRELREEQEATNSNLQKFSDDLAATTAMARKLQETIERKVEPDIHLLRDELGRTKLDLAHLEADHKGLKDGFMQDQDNLRDANDRLKALLEQLGATNTKVNSIDKRLSETCMSGKNTKSNLEDLNVATLKLHEDHENTKKDLADLKGVTSKVNSHLKHVHENLDKVSTSLQHTQQKFDDMNVDTDAGRQNMDEVRDKVRALENSQDRARDLIQQLRQQLAETSATTERVRAGLKEHSSLLLPNLSLDCQEARLATQRHGSLLMPGNLVGSTSPNSARRPVSRGGRRAGAGTGTAVPNQMAWT